LDDYRVYRELVPEQLCAKIQFLRTKAGIERLFPMTIRIIDFEIVRKIGLALPGVEESTAYGCPALKVQGKLLACIPGHHSCKARAVRWQILEIFCK
jgi:hypothetical protein